MLDCRRPRTQRSSSSPGMSGKFQSSSSKSAALVAYLAQPAILLRLDRYGNRTAGWAELDGVVHDVGEHAADEIVVAAHGRGLRHTLLDAHTTLACQRTDQVDAHFGGVREIH